MYDDRPEFKELFPPEPAPRPRPSGEHPETIRKRKESRAKNKAARKARRKNR